jgi:hypothetical protein
MQKQTPFYELPSGTAADQLPGLYAKHISGNYIHVDYIDGWSAKGIPAEQLQDEAIGGVAYMTHCRSELDSEGQRQYLDFKPCWGTILDAYNLPPHDYVVLRGGTRVSAWDAPVTRDPASTVEFLKNPIISFFPKKAVLTPVRAFLMKAVPKLEIDPSAARLGV